MFSNYNIWKYCAKYFFLMTISAYVFNFGTQMANAKNDFLNLIAAILFAGLLIGVLLVLKSDVTKLVRNVKNKEETKKNDE